MLTSEANYRRLAVALIVIVIALFGLAWYFGPSHTASRDDAQAKAVVVEFGSVLKNVSLLAEPSAIRAAIDESYKPYVTPELLAAWEANPTKAPGRETSSPWPDRVGVGTVAPQGRGRVVSGEIIYMTSAEATGTSADTVPFVAQVVPTDSGWKIASFDIQPVPTVHVTSDED